MSMAFSYVTGEQIAAELARLRNLQVHPFYRDRPHSVALIRAQADALEMRLSEADVYGLLNPNEIDLTEAALQTAQWLTGLSLSRPSDYWERLAS